MKNNTIIFIVERNAILFAHAQKTNIPNSLPVNNLSIQAIFR
jgi:hypothetical protein